MTHKKNHGSPLFTNILKYMVRGSVLLALSILSNTISAQVSTTNGTPPAPEASCTVTAMNRTAPLQGDYSFTIYNIPGAATAIGPQNIGNTTPAPPFRVRAVCSDGTVGETELAFPEFGTTVVYTGEIFWRPATPIPLAINVTAAQSKLSANQTTQLATTGILANATTVDLTARSKGTLYTSSNPLIATVNEAGLATVMAQFASGSSSRVVMTAQNEGVAGSTVLQIGPRGRLTGRIYRADGMTPVAGAQVTIIRNQPRESLGTVTTDSSGNYSLEDVSAGAFSLSVIEPASGDLGRGDGVLQTEGETSTVDVRLNGQGTVIVTVLNGADAPVSNASVTFTSLSGYRDIRTLQTNASGQVVLERALAGQFTVSTRDTSSNLVGAALGTLLAGGTSNVTLKLQPVGSIAGTVYSADGTTTQGGIQVRLVSAVRGIITQVVTAEDGKFQFDSLPLSDGPYTLDAMQDGRLRARVPNLILTQAGQQLAQNVIFAPAGMITGIVVRNDGSVVEGATVTVQSLVGQRFSFSTKSNAQGRYTIDGVSVGAFGLTAVAGNGEVASAGGSVASDGDIVSINLQLAANGIVGTVYGRDGKTPVAAGVTVTLIPGNVTTQTNAQGQYGFSVAQPNTYTVEAFDAKGNRGRSSIVLTAITPGDPKTLDVVFLARGSVQGVVRDPNGAVQSGAPVTLTSSSLFGGTATTSADSEGRYRFDGVFIGEFSVYSRNVTTNLAGIGRGRLAENGDVAAADITLAATGSVAGKVVKNDNTTPVAGAVVELNVSGATGLRATADSQGGFNFPAVPLGDFSLLATNPLDGDKGQVVSRLVTLNEARTVSIRLLGQGAVRVKAINSANGPVQGVSITATSASQFGGTFRGITDAEGIVTFSPVFNGDVSVSGEKGTGITRISGFASTTVVNGSTAEATLTMLSKPIGSVAGVVTKGLNADPQAGATVRLSNLNTGEQRSVITAADGAYGFDVVEVGPNYRVTAILNDRVRARADVTLSAEDEKLTRNLALIGVGTVNGRATNAQNQTLSGILITLSNPDPTYGGTWSVTTQADGTYSFTNIPAGNFTVRARSNDGRLQAQGSGMVRFDADTATVNLTLVDNAINLPVSLYDANGTVFDLQGDGSVGTGTSNVFRGNGGADVRAGRLEIIVSGVAVPFQNGDGTIGRLTQLGQLLEVDDFHQASGLDITRRIYVPQNGYFARTMEVLENRTTNPITVGVKVVSNIAPGVVGARVVDTSSNDSVLDVTADASRDRWVVLDDDRDADPFEVNNNPSVAMVFDGTGAATHASNAEVTAVGTVAKVGWQWENVTIQPGASVAFMHFTSQQLGRIPAREAAERLVQLPPEALEGLTVDERAIIQNFKVPADGLSTLTPLPSVENSTVSGIVYAGDGTTPISYATVKLKSDNRLFGRTYQTQTDKDGRYTFNSQNFGRSSVVAVAQDIFNAIATHPQTTAATAPGAATFTNGQSSVEHDLMFVGTGNLTGTVKRHTGALVTSGTVTIPYLFPGKASTQPLSTAINADGTFKYTGIAPGDYLATATQNHPQGNALNGSAIGAVAVPAATTTVVAVTMEDTGEVTGTVRAANGEPVVGAYVQLDPNPYYGPYRATQTDTGGNFRFTDVRLGDHTVLAMGNNGLQETGSTNVVKDTAAVVNLQLAGTGQINVQVNYQRGAPAVNTYVSLVGRTTSATNGAGQVSFSAPSDVPLTVRTWHPDNSDLGAEGTATINGNGGTADVTLTLPAAGSIVGTLMRPDGTTPAAGVSIVVRRQDGTVYQRSTTTNSAGVYRVNGLPLAPYSVSAEDRATFKFAYADTSVASDGQEVSVNLRLADNRIALPADLRDANDFLFDIQRDGSISAGWRARTSTTYSVYQNGGSLLEINGQMFAGDVGAFLEAGRRQFAITQPTPLAGLNVSRKIFVPRGGYFARYLEILENPTASPITVTAKVKTKFRNTSTYIYGTSTGDTELQANATQRDTWIVMDDSRDEDPFISNSQPATALVLGPSESALPHDQLMRNTSSGVALDAGWSSVTVPANGRIVLMHFEVQQINRAGAIAAAERLQQLPPEALDALTNDEVAAIANFNVPSNAQSSVAALPSLLGRVSGVVYEGDGRTVVPNAAVELRSSHPLFGRTWTRSDRSPCDWTINVESLRATAAGAYSLTGRLQDQGSIPLPVGYDVQVKAAETKCYSSSGIGHPLTRIPSSSFTGSFGEGSSEAVQNVLFNSGILTGTVVGPTDYGVGGGSLRIVLPPNINVSSNYTVTVTIANDGSYVFPGLPEGSHNITASIPHNQGTALVGTPVTATTTESQTTVMDIAVEPTGSATGVVVTANGEASVGSSVVIRLNGGARTVQRSTTTDSLGRFNLSALPIGEYTLSVTDSRTGAITSAIINVAQNQVTSQSVTLIGAGAVQLTVNYARGVPASNVDVYLRSPAVGTSFVVKGRTDAQGRLNVLVPVGDYTLRVRHPLDNYYSNMWVESSGTIVSNNESRETLLTLSAHAAVRITVVDQDAGNAPIASAQVTLTDSACPSTCGVGSTNGSGQFLLTNVHEGSYNISVRTSQGRIVQLAGVIGAEVDGQTLERTLSVTATADKLSVLTFAGERHLYSIPANANDIISIGIGGTQVNGSQSAYLTRVQVYDVNRLRLAQGYGYDSRNSYAQYNEAGNLTNIVAPVSGNHTIAVSPYYDSLSEMGGYRLQVRVNGQAVNVLPYADGGTADGTVVSSSGSPVAGQSIEIQTSDVLGLRVRTETDSNGLYRFAGVPISGFTVKALDPLTKASVISASNVVETTGQTVTTDIQMPIRTSLQVQISIPGGLSVPSQLYFSVTDVNGLTRQEGPVTFVSGETISSVRTIYFYGERATLRVVHPYNSAISATTIVQGVDGQTIPVVLTLATAAVQGSVLNGAGAPVGGAYVRAQTAGNNNYLADTYTDSEGRYQFAALPVGEEVLLRTQEPNTAAWTTERATLQLGQTVTKNLRMSGVGAISGTVISNTGTPVRNVEVVATYVYDDVYNYTTQRYGYTNDAGEYSIGNIPSGRPVSVVASLYTSFGSVTGTGNVTLANHGESAVVNIPLEMSGGSVLIRVVGADNQPIPYSCRELNIQAADGRTGRMSWVGCGNGVTFTGVPAGEATISGYMDYVAPLTPITVNVADGQQVEVVLKVSLIRGVVQFSDGTPVPWPSITLTNDTQTIYGERNDQGEYRVYGANAGAFTLRAQDSDAALQVTASGNLVDTNEPLVLNLTLPPSGVVTGVFRDRNNQPIANAEVYVRSSTSDVDRYASTDANGVYRVEKVAIGTITAVARRYSNPEMVATATGQLTTAAPVLALDLQAESTGEVTGRVLNSAGSPVANARVSLHTVKSYGAFGTIRFNASADANGNFSFAGVPIGEQRLIASHNGIAGTANVTVSADSVTASDITIGGAAVFPLVLNGSDSARYDLDSNGALSDGGFGNRYDAYDGAYYLYVNGNRFPYNDVAPLITGDREVVLGPHIIANLQVARRVYVPISGGYARYIETLTNPTSSEITVPVRVNGNLGSDYNTRLIVSPAQSGGRYAVTIDPGYDPALAHVFASAAAALVGTQTFNPPGDEFSYTWNVTIPAGGTVSLMHFAVQRASGDSGAAQAQAEALSAMTQSGMFEGLSNSDRTSIKNFAVNP